MNGTCKNLLLGKTTDKDKCKTIYDRNFKTTVPNQKWVLMSQNFISQLVSYICLQLLIFFTREIVSFDVSISPNYR